MASTLTPTSFKINIKEEQVVRNNIVTYEVSHTIENVTNVDHRILTCPNTTSIDLFNINGVNPGAGTFPSSSLQYARITNLDDTLQCSNYNEWFTKVILHKSYLHMIQYL